MSSDAELISRSQRQLQSRLEALRQSAPYRAYERMRDWVMTIKDLEAARRQETHAPSQYWREELSGFEYMLDASPLVIEKLRHHTHHVTGLRPYEYRSNYGRAQSRFRDKLTALVNEAGGRGLFIPESDVLGGFGHDLDGERVNLDTLKFFEVLIVLERGAVLQEFRDNPERRLVWEIGAGWGGFPYVFKTLCRNVTYVITDLPELFLFSGTYLATVFPDARFRFFGDVPADRLFDRWEDYDFIFVPDTFHESVRPERVDLTINMVSFQEMTTAQVTAYVRRAAQLGSPFLYSLNRDRSSYNRELSSVWSIIEQYYWPHDYRVLPVGYTKMLDEVPTAPERDYKHTIGWKRIASP
jgi:putative sugar O-methyltransferase